MYSEDWNLRFDPSFLKLQNKNAQNKRPFHKIILDIQQRKIFACQYALETQVLKFMPRLQKGDHERRARQVIQTFRILPIILDISEDMKMSLLHKLNHFKLPQINELTILLKRHNEILTYKSQLYTTKKIILTKRPSSSYDIDRFDYDVYDENGVILSSLHNFKKIERLIKLLQTKFRRLQVIYYIQNVVEKDINVGDYLCMKKGFKADVLGIFYHDVNNIEDTLKNVQSLNGVQTSKEEFEKFCLQYAINLIENLNQYSRKFQPFIDIVKTKYMFENYVLDFICTGDKKKKENTRRNQIVLRLINLGYSEFLNSKITYEQLSVQYFQKIFKKIVEKIIRLENQPQKKVSQSQVIDRHQINPTLSDKVQNLTKAYQKMNQSFLPSKKYKP